MRFKQAVLVTCFLAVFVYVASYLVWSRWDGNRLWSFFRPPAGLMSLDLAARYRLFGPTAWEGWKRVESIPGTVFRPCIVVDECLSGRTYLPTYNGTVCFN
jgi:hypothetical protein